MNGRRSQTPAGGAPRLHLPLAAPAPAAPAGAGVTLRVSVLSSCQLRCAYCVPPAGAPDRAGWLGPEEHRAIARAIGARLAKVRFTGGEPLLRTALPDLVRAYAEERPGVPLALTTNGVRLPDRLPALRAAGLRAATVHVDSLRPERYRALMGEADLAEVLSAVRLAREALDLVKVNVVVQRGRNDDEIPDFLDWSRREGIEVRFIELMDTGSAPAFTRAAFFSGAEILARARAARGASPVPRLHPSDPAALHATDDGLVFGVIASDTEPFCGACTRVRLSAEGRLRGCLYEPGGADLRGALREGRLEEVLGRVLSGKRSHHPSLPAPRSPFSMAQTGG